MKNDKTKIPLTIVNDLNADLGKIQKNHDTLLNSEDINLSLHDKSIIQKVSNDFFVNLTDGTCKHFITKQMKDNQGYITYNQMKKIGNMFTELKQGYSKLSNRFKSNERINGIVSSNVSMTDVMGESLHSYAITLGFN